MKNVLIHAIVEPMLIVLSTIILHHADVQSAILETHQLAVQK